MAKNKRATRKQLEKVIGNIIGTVNALDNYLGLYIEYNKDTEGFTKFIENKLNNKTASNVEVKKDGGKQERYSKVTKSI